MLHKLQSLLEKGRLKTAGKILDVKGTGAVFGWGSTVGNGETNGWSPGALFIDTNATSGAQLQINTGTSATATWKAISSLDAANSWASIQTFAAGITVATAQDAVFLKPDGVQVGGKIVPQDVPLVSAVLQVGLVSQLIYTLFVARDAWQVTSMDYVPDVANAAGVGVVVKATGITAPATSITPLNTGAVGFTLAGGANTVQVGTLSATTAALQLTAGDRLAVVLSTAMILGAGCLTIRGKRI